MDLLFPELPKNRQKGSKPRCHLLTDGPRDEVAVRLTSLISPWGVVRSSDCWTPEGFENCEEAQLHLATALLPSFQARQAIRSWWLGQFKGKGQTPTFDLASTCLIDGQEGILLVEAKAHDYELIKEEQGKKLKDDASADSHNNHVQIGNAIQLANEHLTKTTGIQWRLSRDSHYQMSNRFASAWKLTEIGIPVILVYLGFVGCEDMRDGDRQRPVGSAQEWQELVLTHSSSLFPSEVWNREWIVSGVSLIALIRNEARKLIRPLP